MEKEVPITNDDGTISTYTIRKFKPIMGREIVTGYPLSALPKVGDYAANERLMMKLMSTVSIKIGGNDFFLTTPDLIDNHVKGWNSLVKIELEVLKYNCTFLSEPGKMITFTDLIKNSIRDFLVEVFIDAQSKQVD